MEESIISLTKSKLTDIASFLSKIEDCSEMAIFYNDAIYPCTLDENSVLRNYSEKLNGYNLVENRIIPLIENNIYLFNPNCIPDIRELLKKTGIKNITLRINNNMVILEVDNKLITIILNKIPDNILLDNNFKLYQSYLSKVDSIIVDTIENTKSKGMYQPKWYHSTNEQILSIVNGNVVKLEGELNGHKTMVRVSKNIFPLLGVVKTNDDKAFMFSYTFKGTDENPIVVFTVIYKKFNAIHAVGYTDYLLEEE